MRTGCSTLMLAASLGCALDPTPSTNEGTEPPASAAAVEPDDEDPERRSGLSDEVAAAIDDARIPDDLRLLPAGPILLIGLDLAAFVAKPQWRTLASQLGPREREQLHATEACGVGPEKWRRVLLGLAPETNEAAIVVEAVGLGTPEVLRCLRDVIGSFRLADDAKSMSDDTGGGLVLDDDTIVFATSQWMEALRERLADRGPAAYDGALRQASKRAGFGHAAWLGLLPTPELQGIVTTAIGSEIEDVSGSIDTTPEGYEARLVLACPNAMMATLRIEGQRVVLHGLALANGLPTAVLDAVQVRQEGNRVKIELTATDAQVDELVAALRDLLQRGW